MNGERASQKLKSILDKEILRIGSSVKGSSYHSIQHIVRRLDFVLLFYNNDAGNKDENNETVSQYFRYGWAQSIKPFYSDLNLNVHEPFPEIFKEAIKWADSVILFAGRIATGYQLIEYEKADLIEIFNPAKNEFTFEYKNQHNGIEHFDKLSKDFFKEKVIESLIAEKMKESRFDESGIKDKLKSIIKNPSGKYISYITTPEIDEYYNKKGHYFLLRLQGYDDFGSDDTFGSIEYWKYIDLIELICGVAIMHTEACLELCKMNKNVDLHNLLTYTHSKDKTIEIYSNYLGATKEDIGQIFSCLTLNKDNFDYYLQYPAASLPMYIEVGGSLLIRSVAGCLGNPIELLNRELKRKFKRDYDLAVNRREERFRKELFAFFQDERIIKIPKEINISFNDIKTDIDAVVYDKKTKTLGIFQLKWQDPFSSSMKERFSRISNLFEKANEWLEKMKYWINNNTAKVILNALQINKYCADACEINEICVFVISRNNINFTGVKVDERAAWGTWYQLIESQASLNTNLDDPIREMFIKLKMFSPEERIKRDKLPEKGNFDMSFGEYRVYYNENKDKN